MMRTVLLVAERQSVIDQVHAALASADSDLIDHPDSDTAAATAYAKNADAVVVDMRVGSMGAMAVTRDVRAKAVEIQRVHTQVHLYESRIKKVNRMHQRLADFHASQALIRDALADLHMVQAALLLDQSRTTGQAHTLAMARDLIANACRVVPERRKQIQAQFAPLMPKPETEGDAPDETSSDKNEE